VSLVIFQWLVCALLVICSTIGWIFPEYSYLSGAAFGLVALILAIDAKAARKKQNRDIVAEWEGRHKE
jgi:hypothetical protein